MQTNNLELRALAERIIAECAAKARAAGLPVPSPALAFNLRGRSRAGLYRTRADVICLNPDYFAVQGEAYAATIAHEYAHAVHVAAMRTGRMPMMREWHGPDWQRIMLTFGYEPERCVPAHEAIPPKARRTRQYVYECPACLKLINLSGRSHAAQEAATRAGSSAGTYHKAAACQMGGAAERRLRFTGRSELT